MTLWMAPILSYTAEEIWQYIPNKATSSVFLAQWYQDFPAAKWANLKHWSWLEHLRNEVNKATELKRQQGLVGSGLASGVRLYFTAPALEWLQAYAQELKFLFICSEASLIAQAPVEDSYFAEELGVSIEVYAVDLEKCERCWHRVPSVGVDSEYPGLCQRCLDNISGRAEQRAKI